MSQESLVLVMGILVFLTPYLGISNSWKRWVFIVLGALITVVGYRLRRAAYFRSIETTPGERRADAFVENATPVSAFSDER